MNWSSMQLQQDDARIDRTSLILALLHEKFSELLFHVRSMSIGHVEHTISLS